MSQEPSRQTNPKKTKTPVIPAQLRPEVQAAVNDILSGDSTDCASEWLQREYRRLMEREALYRKNQSESSQS